MGEAARRKRQRAIATGAIEAIRETFWASLGETGEQLGIERTDMLLLLLEKGMLLDGFSEAEAERFIARLEQIGEAFERRHGIDPEPHTIDPQAAAEGPVLPPLPNPEAIGRLALRAQGNDWVAYYAMADTMEGAVELGRINFALIEREPRRQWFMTLMQEAVADIIEERVGQRPIYPNPARAVPGDQ